MTELEVAAFRRDCAALAGHVRAGLRGDGFGKTARQALDKLLTLAYGAAGLGEEARAISAFSPEQRAELEKPIAPAPALDRWDGTFLNCCGLRQLAATWCRLCRLDRDGKPHGRGA